MSSLSIKLFHHRHILMCKEILQALNNEDWLYGAASDLPEISRLLTEAADKCHRLNLLYPSQNSERNDILKGLLGSTGKKFNFIGTFRCDFGFNIHIGENFAANFNLTVLDEAEVRIGDNVMIGPNCSLITITHALTSDQRNSGIMRARPIHIGNNVWIAANVTVLPGVTIGDGAVIGAGSVVTKSIPAGVLAAGNPCRPIRPITDADIVTPVM